MPYKIFPRPKSIVYPGGVTSIGEIGFTRDEALPEQGYKITLTEHEQSVAYADEAGRRYALQTLEQLRSQGGAEASCVCIEDAPGIKRRGMLLDISRDKVPTLDTLRRIVDILDGMRINELQLYVQGYSYEYDGWQTRFPEETPVTKAELAALRDYAAGRGITLIPNMNCLGHLDMWLALPELNSFAECPGGFPFQGLYHRDAGTIDPNDAEARKFIQDLCDDMLDGFEGGMFNANLDEPFELGMGKSRDVCGKDGKAAVYAGYIRGLNEYINKKGFEMMIWGDVIYARPDSVGLLPSNVILLDWIYEGSGRFERHAKIAADTGFKFYVCPGTSAWCSFLGRSDNMKENIRDAADTALRYGAYGMMTTDWGDLGHWQYLPVSYLGYAFAGAYGWNPETDDESVFSYLDSRIFKDPGFRTARLMYELGNYYQKEKTAVFNTTESFFLMTRQFSAPTREALEEQLTVLEKKALHIAGENAIPYEGFHDEMDGESVVQYIDSLCAELQAIRLNADDGALVIREIRNAARFAMHGAKLHDALYSNGGPSGFAALTDDLSAILEEHRQLWEARNKTGGYARSVSQLNWLLNFYQKAGERQ